MNRKAQAFSNEMDHLVEDARGLLAATAEVAGDKVGDARKRLAAALDSGKEMYDRAKEQAAQGVRAADETVRENPYQAIVIGVGVGAILGFLIGRQCPCKRN